MGVILKFSIQLNIHQTELWLWYVSHDLTWNCLLIWWFLKIWKGLQHRNTELILFWILDVQNNFMFPTMGEQSKVGKFSEINKQFHVKSWLTYRSYSSVWWILSCSSDVTKSKLKERLHQILWLSQNVWTFQKSYINTYCMIFSHIWLWWPMNIFTEKKI